MQKIYEVGIEKNEKTLNEIVYKRVYKVERIYDDKRQYSIENRGSKRDLLTGGDYSGTVFSDGMFKDG